MILALAPAAMAGPVVELYSFLGGAGFDALSAGAIDRDGNLIVAGVSNASDLPANPSIGEGGALFLSKIDPTGSRILFTKVLSRLTDPLRYGPNFGPEAAIAVAVDSDGSIFVLGGSTRLDLPVTAGAWESRVGSRFFLARFTAAGEPVYFTRLGPPDWAMVGTSLAVRNGVAYVGGYTNAAGFAGTAGAYQPASRGMADGVVLAMRPDGSAPLWVTAIGGASSDYVWRLAVEESGSLAGIADTDSADFPVAANAFPVTAEASGSGRPVLFRLSADGAQLLYSTRLGRVAVSGLAPLTGGDLLIGGSGVLPDAVTAGLTMRKLSLEGDIDGYVARLGQPGEVPRWVSQLGQGVTGLVSGDNGMIYALTNLNWATGGAVPKSPFTSAGFLQLNSEGSQVLYASRLPWMDNEKLTIGPGSRPFLTGTLLMAEVHRSPSTPSPGTPGSVQPEPNRNAGSGSDGFFARLNLSEFTGPNFGVVTQVAQTRWRIGETSPVRRAALLAPEGTSGLDLETPPGLIARFVTTPTPAVEITINPDRRDPGLRQEQVIVRDRATGRTVAIDVPTEILGVPTLTLSADSIELRVREGEAINLPAVTVTVGDGGEQLGIQAVSGASWLGAQVSKPEPTRWIIQPRVYTALAAGIYETTVAIDYSPVITAIRRTLRVRIVVDPPPTFLVTGDRWLRLAPGTLLGERALQVTSDPPGVPWMLTIEAKPEWVTMSPSGGTAPGELRVSANATGVTPGLYEVRFAVTGAGGVSPRRLSFSLVVNGGTAFSVNPRELNIDFQQPRQGAGGGITPPPASLLVTAAAGTRIDWRTSEPFRERSGFITGPGTLSLPFEPMGEGTVQSSIELRSGSTLWVVPVTVRTYYTPDAVVDQAPLTFRTLAGGPAPVVRELPVTAAGALAAAVTVSAESASGFLKASLDRNTTPAVLRIAADPAGLAAGNYPGQVRLLSPAGAHVIPVTLTVGAVSGTAVAVKGVANGASFASDSLVPGQILTLFGTGLGPSTLTVAQPGTDSRFPVALAGMEFRIAGIAAPILYVSSGQSSIVVPFGIAGRSEAEIVVRNGSQASDVLTWPVAAARPAVFTADASGKGGPAAHNVAADGSVSLHGAGNPAAGGGIVTLYTTGIGLTDPAPADGTLAGLPLARQVEPVRVTVGGAAATVLYSGPAPGLIVGLTQINIQVPAGLAAGAQPLVVWAGERPSPAGVVLYVK